MRFPKTETENWFRTAVLAGLWAIVIWSGGVMFGGNTQLYREATDIYDHEFEPLSREMTLGSRVRSQLDSINRHMLDRSDSFNRLLPDPLRLSTLHRTVVQESLASRAIHLEVEAAKDSVLVSSFRGFELPRPEERFVSTVEQLLFCERRLWRHAHQDAVSEIKGIHTKNIEEFATYYYAYDISRTGVNRAYEILVEVAKDRVTRLREIGERVTAEARKARLLGIVAIVAFGAALTLLHSIWHRRGPIEPLARSTRSQDSIA